MTATSTPMIEWLNDTDIDPEWIRRHMPSSQFETTVKASVVDMSNQGRKGARPRDGATLLLTLTMSSSSSSSNEQEEDEEETPKTKTLVIKQVPDSGLALSKQLGLAREAFFFTDLAPKIGTSTTTTTASSSSSSSSSTSLSIPTVYYAYGDMDCGTKVVIMEDLSDGYIDSGILFGPGNPNNWNRDLPNLIADAYNNVDNKVPTSFEVANRTFLSIAQVHATFWNDETLLEPSKTSYLRGAHWINGDHKESWQASQGLIQNMWKSINSDNDNTTTSNDSSDTKTKKKTVDERIRWDPLVKEVLQTATEADLTPSNCTQPKGAVDYQKDTPAGRYFRFGVREHGMGAVTNGLYAYGGMRPYCATFLTFMQYMLGAVRLSALSQFPVLYIFTHDSIGLGEDGPTHQPIEHLEQLRAIPNLYCYRPADSNEMSAAYKVALEATSTPTCIAASRSTVKGLFGSSIEKASKGGYVAVETDGTPDLILVSSGSEVGFCVEAAKNLTAGGTKTSVVSMPCVDLFLEQSDEYQASVLPGNIPTLSVEASSPHGWHQFAHSQLSMNSFGSSGPGGAVYKHFGFTPENIAAKGKSLVEHYKKNGPVPALRNRLVFKDNIPSH